MNCIKNARGEVVIAEGAPGSIARARCERLGWPTLTYMQTVYGDRVRVCVDDIASGRRQFPLYNQYGRRLSDNDANRHRATTVHRENLIYGPVCLLPE